MYSGNKSWNPTILSMTMNQADIDAVMNTPVLRKVNADKMVSNRTTYDTYNVWRK